jgi:hypothetical protein
MKLFAPKTLVLSLPAAVLLLATDPAFAFRCGSKLVRDGMHEQQVIAACGEPTSVSTAVVTRITACPESVISRRKLP